ncbi:Ig-like domain-containing protein [Demequina sp. NBRC 110055]|uniref:Ig-like domain-containing protein n=1 Tax=Demequina sp. NBRC 110055 TaxID=1570344 RepID=UPI0009FD41A5|nr:Ig-like domain-containing protein [Demequina sp. NBRC 110055]
MSVGPGNNAMGANGMAAEPGASPGSVEAGLGRATAARRRRMRRIGVGALIATVVAGAVLAPGFDEREVEADDASVWALQTATGQRFARINTAVAEIDTVKSASAPSDLVQAASTLLVYSDNLGSVTSLDTARPHDIDTAAPEGTVSTPVGTDVVAHTGDAVAYLTETGEVYAGLVSAGTAMEPRALDPFAEVEVGEGEDRPRFSADAVAVAADGRVAAYSAERRSVMTADAATGDVLATTSLPEGPVSDDLQIAWVGERWVLLEGDDGWLWIEGLDEPVATTADEDPLLQESGTSRTQAILADEYGAIAVELDGSGVTRVYGSLDLALGEPARPLERPDGSGVVAAWLPAGEGPGTMWASDASASSLDYGGLTLGDRRTPVLRSNGARMILNEARTGWVWSVPSGALVTSSQQWERDDEVQAAEDDREVATEVTDPRAPVAVDDALGVRAGRQVALPVLLNDHDANGDVLTIDPGSVTGLDDSFGSVSVADDAQALVIDVADDASGSASFTYAVTDGTTDDGLLSSPATVTVTAKDASENSPPVWCGVDACQLEWPTPQVNPGGTVTTDVLTGWVDPEGDPVYLASARTSSDVGVVAASPEGQVVFQHTDASSTDTGAVPIEVVVADAHGATTSKDLSISVVGEPELAVADIAVTVSQDVTTTVEVGDHVTGARGPLSVTEASLGLEDDAVVATAQGTVGFSFTAPEAGSYLVDFTVTDGVADARGKVRVTVLSEDEERLTTVPLTAFVRASEDVTVDVLAAVTNPAGSVLLLSDLATDPEDGARLSADVVGHSALRLSGDTGDGQPGTLGTVGYTVSDGTGRPEGTVRGEVTVILLGTEVPTTPLAVDDALTVRVGTQADISVLANDVGPAGNVIALDAASVALSDGGGLAFPAGNVIRYLAPDTPGVYTIDYAAYVLGYPTQADTAKVVVTVLDSDTNQPPVPRPLAGRVAAGQEVRLPFDGTGTDPDGDAVALNRIETQPESGSARVSSDGRSLVYAAEAGYAGQASFTFSVIDARGAIATATATVGVLAEQLDPRPVTYTDYVQAQVGEDRRVIVTPTANDVDLGGGELELTAVRPDAEPDSAEYAALASHLIDVEGERVTLAVGDEPGTLAFTYTVANASGSTSIGRIIVKAVREPIADVPIVADTVLTSDTRETFATGVDVLTDKVAWGGGDAGALSLSLWGEQPDLTATGWSISGPLPQESRLVPFQVSGQNFAGEAVTSYGFLRVPGEEELRIALRDSFEAPEVNEGESVDIDLASLIALPPETAFTIDGAAVRSGGVRPEGRCDAVAGTVVRYTAGEGEPYSDTCEVPVTVVGQDQATVLPVPIVVIPAAPQPTLTGASLEIAPGDTATFDLNGMVSWPVGAAGRAVEFATTYQGEQFTVTPSGTSLQIAAADTAIPGSLDTVTVTLTSDPETPPVTLSLEVGPAPSALPKGGTVAKQCAQDEGSSCEITVIGATGEVNPLPGTPLELVSVSADGTCRGVSFEIASETAVRASWSDGAPGAVCDATFVVRDAQGRLSSGDRLGRVSLDLQGYPAGPASVSQAAYGDGTVTLAVSPGAAAQSYPKISGFHITRDGTEVATCTASGVCSQITGVPNGDKRQYTAVAVNSVGTSASSASTTAWSYAPPAKPTQVTWEPSQAGADGGKVDIAMTITDASTRSVRLEAASGATATANVSRAGSVSVDGFAIGSNEPTQITITPVTRFELPPVGSSSEQGESVTLTANGVGGPKISSPTWKANDAATRVTFTVAVASAGAGSTTWVGVAEDNRRCTPTVQSQGGTASVTVEVTENEVRNYDVCAESRWQGTPYGTASLDVDGVFAYQDPGAPRVTRGYDVDDTCRSSGFNRNSCETGWDRPAVDNAPRGFELRYIINGGTPTTTFTLENSFGSRPSIQAVYCPTFLGANAPCSDSRTTVDPVSEQRAYPTSVSFTGCTATDTGRTAQVAVAAQGGHYSVQTRWFANAIGNQEATERWESNYAEVTVTFTGALADIEPFQSGRMRCDVTAQPPVEPDPDPTPTPTPEPTTPSPEPTDTTSPAP